MAEQRLANCVTEKVLENITPYITAQWQEEQHDKKKQKSIKKRIKRLDAKMAELELDQGRLCQALAYFLAAAANISMSNISAADLEKSFKELYKKYKKAQKHSSRNLNELPMLPMDVR